MGHRARALLLCGGLSLGLTLGTGCSRTAMQVLGEGDIDDAASEDVGGSDAPFEDVSFEDALVDAAFDAPLDVEEDASIEDAPTDLPPDVAPDVELSRCRLVSAGAPKTILSFTDRHATAPSIVALGTGRPATIAMQALASGGSSPLHSDIQLARVQVGDWPTGVVVDRPPQLVGVETHGWGELSRAHPPRADLALAWHGDPGGVGRPIFRTFDPATWTAGPLVDVTMRGEAVLALARGASIVGNAYAGTGYAIAWRDVDPMLTRPRLTVLDATGARSIDVLTAAPAAAYPGPTPAIAWSGSHYLVAVSHGDCPPDECTPFSVSVQRLLPPGMNGPAELTQSTVFPPSAAGRIVFRPALARVDGAFDSFLAWGEGTTSTAPRDIRLAWLDATGKSLRDITVATNVRAIGAVVVAAGPLGIVVAWPEAGDTTLPIGALGRDRIVVHHFDRALAPLSPAVTIPIPQFDDYGRVSLAWLDRGLLLAWGGAKPAGELPPNQHDVSLLARLDCVDP